MREAAKDPQLARLIDRLVKATGNENIMDTYFKLRAAAMKPGVGQGIYETCPVCVDAASFSENIAQAFADSIESVEDVWDMLEKGPTFSNMAESVKDFVRMLGNVKDAFNDLKRLSKDIAQLKTHLRDPKRHRPY